MIRRRLAATSTELPAFLTYTPLHRYRLSAPNQTSSVVKRKSVLDDSDDSDAEAVRDPTPVKRKRRVVLDSDSDDE